MEAIKLKDTVKGMDMKLRQGARREMTVIVGKTVRQNEQRSENTQQEGD